MTIYLFLKLNKVGAEVNVKDRFAKTPLIYSCCVYYVQSTRILCYLIQKGANLNISDMLNKNALVHACIMNNINDEAIIILLKNGGICSSRMPYVFNRFHTRISILRPLISEKKFAIARMLIKSGYNIANETFSSDDFKDEALFKGNFGFCEWMINYFKNPRKLVNICRAIIRSESNGANYQEKVKKLNIPAHLKQYLMMKEFF